MHAGAVLGRAVMFESWEYEDGRVGRAFLQPLLKDQVPGPAQLAAAEAAVRMQADAVRALKSGRGNQVRACVHHACMAVHKMGLHGSMCGFGVFRSVHAAGGQAPSSTCASMPTCATSMPAWTIHGTDHLFASQDSEVQAAVAELQARKAALATVEEWAAWSVPQYLHALEAAASGPEEAPGTDMNAQQ